MRNIKKFIHEVLLEAKVSASSEYMQKEVIRQDLQDMIASKVASGEIVDQAQLDEWFKTATMALGALKMVPIEAYGPQKKPKRRSR